MTKWKYEGKGGPFLYSEGRLLKKTKRLKRDVKFNPNWVDHPAITVDSEWLKELSRANPEALKNILFWDESSIAPLKFDYTDMVSKERIAMSLLKETMGDDLYSELVSKGHVTIRGSNGKLWTINKNGVVINPEGVTGRLVKSWFPLGDALVALYLNIIGNAKEVEDRWACGNLSMTYRGRMD
ncbi:MAG: hypothetical protein KGN01_06810 [Patescibacteria group bacterium]|nr:hypothetical protein [Patescibacteria group bacterium]